MNAKEIKALGSVWGAQDGLLSESELELLMQLIREEPGPLEILEVGHYYGMSTCAIVHALDGREDWYCTTIDAHIADPWVTQPAPISAFQKNRLKYFHTPRCEAMFIKSQELRVPVYENVVFYDGDHGLEQKRFTQCVIESPETRLFIFDDRDFNVPFECVSLLRNAGWFDCSPPCQRFRGDKRNPKTMTLGVFRKAEEG